MRAWNKATSEPWAITEHALQTILEIAARENASPEAVAAKLGRELQNTHRATEREGVALIPVTGPLFRYANIFTMISGATSYEMLAQDFISAIENPNIHAIILDIDSPGGEVNGCAELASLIHEARGQKPIIAYASGDAASGAYWIASAADEIVVSETSALGSIGVVGVYRKPREDKNGPETIEIVSSQSPFKRLDPASEDGRARLQSRMDAMAEVFVTTVARHRGIEPQRVLERFGGGDVLIGAHAVQAGLADRTGSLEKLVAQLAHQNPALQRGFLMPASPSNQPKETIMDVNTLKEKYPDLLAQLQADARNGERIRVQTVLESDEATGRESLARHLAFATDMAPDVAVAMLNKAPKEAPKADSKTPATGSFEQVMRDLGNPAIQPGSNSDADDIEATARRLAAS